MIRLGIKPRMPLRGLSPENLDKIQEVVERVLGLCERLQNKTYPDGRVEFLFTQRTPGRDGLVARVAVVVFP